MPITRATKPRSAIYTSNSGILLVPTCDQWYVHEASKFFAILERAGLGRPAWAHDRHKIEVAHPGFHSWLYGARALPTNGFEPEDSMLAFQKHATIAAILAAASRSRKRVQAGWRSDYCAEIGDNLLSYWRKKHKEQPWLERWLLRGEEAPPHVTVATLQQIQRCTRAWDYGAFCKRMGSRADSTYGLWLSDGLIPNVGWLRWLFNGPVPKGAFVVIWPLQRLRGEMGIKAIMKAVGLNLARLHQWKQSPLTGPVIRAILAGGDPAATEQWGRLHPNTRQQMEAVRKARSLEACCARAGIALSGYYTLLREAERCGVKGELQKYLSCQAPYPAGSRQCGLVLPNFFIPSALMWRFRGEAEREGTEQKIWSLWSQNLPGFEQWFLDWVTPRARRGRRHAFPETTAANVAPIGPMAPDGHPRADQKPRGRGRPSESDPKVVKRNAKMRSDWEAKRFDSISGLAKHYHISRTRASHIINDRT
jgi:hypothetical protein